MPDDEILEQEVAEQPDPDAMAGFDLGAKDADKPSDQKGEKPPEEKKDEAKGEPVKDEKLSTEDDKPPEKDEKPPEKKPDEKLDEEGKPKDEEPPKKEEDLTAKDRIDQRVKELELPLQDDKPPKKEEQPPEHPAKETGEADRLPPPKEAPPASKLDRLTKEQMADYLRTIPDDILPDETVFIGDTEVNLKDFAEEFPEQFAAVKILSGIIAQQAIDKNLEGKKTGGEDNEAIQKRLNDQDALIQSLLWWDAVTEKHSDAKQVKASKDFQAWFDKQPNNVQRFGSEQASPDDANLLLDFYKEDIAKEAVKKHDDTARDKKKHTDDLHKGTMRTKNDIRTQDNIDMDDAEAGFTEGAKE